MRCKNPQCLTELAPLEVESHLGGAFADIIRKAALAPRNCPACYAAEGKRNWIAQCRVIWAQRAPQSAQNPDDGRSALNDSFHAGFPASLKVKRNLFLVGPCRSGKTYLAWRLLLSAMINGKSIQSINGERFSYTLRGFSADINAMIDELAAVDVLLIDEFGKVDLAEKGIAKLLFSVINARTEAQKVTVFTANASLDKMQAIASEASPTMAEPIFTRLRESMEVLVMK